MKHLLQFAALLLLLAMWPRASWATIQVVQAASNHNWTSSNLDVTCTFASNVTAGNAIIVYADSSDGASAPTYTNAMGTDGGSPADSFTLLGQVNDTNTSEEQYGGLWYTTGSAGGFKTVTIKFSTISGLTGYSRIVAFEVSGLASNGADVGNTNIVHGTGGSSSNNGDTSGQFSTNNNGELIVAAFGDIYDGGTWTAGTSPLTFTIPANGQDSTAIVAMEYAIQTTKGSITPAITNNTTDGYIAMGWSFKAAGGNAYTATPSETNTVSDTLSRAATLKRGDSETNTASDGGIARTASFARSGLSETNTASDTSPARVATLKRTDSETNTASDSLLGSRNSHPWTATITETLTFSDAAGRVAGFARGESETSSTSDISASLRNFTLSLPIKTSSNGRYLTDQNGTPWFMVGDAAWFMMNALTPVQMSTYMSARQSQGFNAILVVIAGDPAGASSATGKLADGTAPFTTGGTFSSYDVSTPNPAYFAEIDEMVSLASSYGLTVLLNALDNYTTMYAFENSGTTKTYNYGAFLGNRYKNSKNVIWVHGNDFQDWSTSSTDNGLAAQLMAGISSADANHLQSLELNYQISGSCDDSTTLPYTGLALAYTYYPVYYEVNHEWSSCSPTMPVFLGESYYENGTYGLATPTTATNQMLRSIEWETSLASGLAGYIYGNANVWAFGTGWQSYLSSTAVTELGYWASFLAGVPWQNFSYDSGHVWVTAGFGTPTGSGSGRIDTDNYVPVSYTTDSKRMVAYDAQGATLTVALGQFTQSVRARWYDPSNGTFQTISGSPFANSGSHNFSTPGSNHDSNSDWVLVLDPSGNVYTATLAETYTALDQSLNRLAGFSRTAAEMSTASDQGITRQATLLRGAQENNTASDQGITRLATLVRTATETYNASDALARLAAYLRAGAETDTATDLLSGLKNSHGYAATLAEALSTGDALGRLAAYLRAAMETNATSGTVARSAGFTRLATELGSTSDVLARTRTAFASLIETQSFADSLARLGIFQRAVSEYDVVSDVVILVRGGKVIVLPRHAETVPGRTKTGTAPEH